MEIPHRVYLTWKTRTPPPAWSATLDELQRLMPDWTVVLASDQDNADFVERYYPELYFDYRHLPYPIMRADLVRYLQLHKYGGFYHDLDICPVKSYQGILDWIEDDAPESSVYLVPTPQGVITNSFMISRPGQSFWYKLAIECILTVTGLSPLWSDLTQSTYILNGTGPMRLSRYIRDNPQGVTVLPNWLVNPYTMVEATYHWKEIRDHQTPWYKPEAHVRPLPGSSWVTSWEKTLALSYMREPTLFWLTMVIMVTLILLVIWCLIRSSPV